MVEPRCSHRGADLFLVEMKSVVYAAPTTAGSLTSRAIVLTCRLRHQKLPSAQSPKAAIRALQVQEYGDLVWGYLGRNSTWNCRNSNLLNCQPHNALSPKNFSSAIGLKQSKEALIPLIFPIYMPPSRRETRSL